MKIGSVVTWKSQSGGSWTEKKGTVIAEIPAGESAMNHVPDSAKKSHINFGVDKSVNDRVLVAVDAGRYGGITHYYCPNKKVLLNQENES